MEKQALCKKSYRKIKNIKQSFRKKRVPIGNQWIRRLHLDTYKHKSLKFELQYI